MDATSVISSWTTTASNIKAATNTLFWGRSASRYLDNQTTTLHPQDGNSWVILSNLTDSSTKALAISTALQSRWDNTAPLPQKPLLPLVLSSPVSKSRRTTQWDALTG